MPRTKRLVSVVIPTRNRAALLKEAVESVLAQEGVGEEFEMEVIVVNDASSDDTAKVLRNYDQVRHIHMQTNVGEGGARNVGIKASRGKYIAFLDDDDLMLPQRLKLQVPAMDAHPEVGVVYSQNIIRGPELRKWWPDATPSPLGNGFDKTWPDAKQAPSGDVFAIFLKEEFLSMDTLLVRRNAFDKAGYFDNLPTGAHYDMFLRLAFYVPFLFVEGNVAVTHANPQGVFHARLHGEEGYGHTLPKIVDRALAMLPDTRYSRQLRSEVHVGLVPRLFCMVERIPDLENARSYVKIVLRACPWLVSEPASRNALAWTGGYFVRGRSSPIAATRAVCEEIKAMAPKGGFKDWLRSRILLGNIWFAVASALLYEPAPHRAAACYAVMRALLSNPAMLAGSLLPRFLGRIALGQRADTVRDVLKRLYNSGLAQKAEV